MTTTARGERSPEYGGAGRPPPSGRPQRALAGSRGASRHTRWTALAFITPLIAYLALFYAYPLWRNIDLSLHDYTPRAFVQGDAEFVGLSNLVDVASSGLFSTALWNTVLFTLVSLLFQYSLGLALAVFFRTHFPLSPILRALFLVPWLLPMIVSASTWAWMLNSDNGIVNAVLGVFGAGPISWLTSPEWALIAVIITNIWLGIPFNLVILYAGLQNIPNDYYEAAALDGANAWQRFWRITMPLLRPVSAITLLRGLVYTLKVIDVIWIMTVGGPGDSSTTLAIWSYRSAFGTGQPDFSEAAMVGNLLILIALALGFVHLYMQRREART